MKNILAVTTLILACSSFAQAQVLSDHPDARNDRRMESEPPAMVHHHRHQQQQHMMQKRMKHHRHMEHKM